MVGSCSTNQDLWVRDQWMGGLLSNFGHVSLIRAMQAVINGNCMHGVQEG